jgi:hypothetical protein
MKYCQCEVKETTEVELEIDDKLKESLTALLFANPDKSLNQLVTEALEVFLKENEI